VQNSEPDNSIFERQIDSRQIDEIRSREVELIARRKIKLGAKLIIQGLLLSEDPEHQWMKSLSKAQLQRIERNIAKRYHKEI
jgi:hypothetical protein